MASFIFLLGQCSIILLPLFINKNWALTPPGINVQRIIYEYFNGILANQLFTLFYAFVFFSNKML